MLAEFHILKISARSVSVPDQGNHISAVQRQKRLHIILITSHHWLPCNESDQSIVGRFAWEISLQTFAPTPAKHSCPQMSPSRVPQPQRNRFLLVVTPSEVLHLQTISNVNSELCRNQVPVQLPYLLHNLQTSTWLPQDSFPQQPYPLTLFLAQSSFPVLHPAIPIVSLPQRPQPSCRNQSPPQDINPPKTPTILPSPYLPFTQIASHPPQRSIPPSNTFLPVNSCEFPTVVSISLMARPLSTSMIPLVLRAVIQFKVFPNFARIGSLDEKLEETPSSPKCTMPRKV